jgi:hypothetical protein
MLRPLLVFSQEKVQKVVESVESVEFNS